MTLNPKRNGVRFGNPRAASRKESLHVVQVPTIALWIYCTDTGIDGAASRHGPGTV
jgi:hypothetical protein